MSDLILIVAKDRWDVSGLEEAGSEGRPQRDGRRGAVHKWALVLSLVEIMEFDLFVHLRCRYICTGIGPRSGKTVHLVTALWQCIQFSKQMPSVPLSLHVYGSRRLDLDRT